MNDEVKPRIWMGGQKSVNAWSWDRQMTWFMVPILVDTDIFVPGSEPKPTINPSKMKTLETSDNVDWNNE